MLRTRLDVDPIEVDVRGPRGDEAHDLGDILGDERLQALVRLGGLVGVAVEADERELRLDEPGHDLGEPNRLAEELPARCSTDSAVFAVV